MSMGTEISEDDVANILNLCDQVIALSEYRAQVCDGGGQRAASPVCAMTAVC